MTESDVVITEMPVDASEIWPRVVAGADWKISFYALDDSEAPQDTTGWAMEVKIYNPVSKVVLKTLSVGAGIVNNTGAGRFDVTYAAADTGALAIQKIYVTMKVTDAGGGVTYPAIAILDVFYP